MDKTLWILVAIFLVLLIVAAIIAVKVFGEKRVKEWLVWAVGKAEEEFGGGTGQLKLRNVYKEFVKWFPKLSLFMTFSRFSFLVDEALEILEVMLKNDKIADIISKTKEE